MKELTTGTVFFFRIFLVQNQNQNPTTFYFTHSGGFFFKSFCLYPNLSSLPLSLPCFSLLRSRKPSLQCFLILYLMLVCLRFIKRDEDTLESGSALAPRRRRRGHDIRSISLQNSVVCPLNLFILFSGPFNFQVRPSSLVTSKFTHGHILLQVGLDLLVSRGHRVLSPMTVSGEFGSAVGDISLLGRLFK